jgi:hypothetical protein
MLDISVEPAILCSPSEPSVLEATSHKKHPGSASLHRSIERPTAPFGLVDDSGAHTAHDPEDTTQSTRRRAPRLLPAQLRQSTARVLYLSGDLVEVGMCPQDLFET